MKFKTNYSLKKGCDENGFFGNYGGKFVAETLMPAIEEVDFVYNKAKNDPKFQKQLNALLKNYAGRPSPLYHAQRLSEYLGGANIFFKRDELNHTGSHKINNCIGQALIAKKMNKKRIIAETGAGQHGVAVASICAKLDLKCVIYMGAKDLKRQKANLARMNILGAEVREVNKGNAVLKDALNEAIRDWIASIDDSYYMIGTAAGPHPYPQIVRDFQSVIGLEAKKQFFDITQKLPDACIACVGGGSNAIGLFYPFLDDDKVKLYGVEAGGLGVHNDQHCATINKGKPGVLHGNSTYLLQDEQGQIIEGHSISAGLDYPGIGPEHAWLNDIKRVKYVFIQDKEAVEAFKLCAKLEGIIPALEPAHALAFVKKIAPKMHENQNIIMNLCGRGDKDIDTIQQFSKIYGNKG